MIQASCYHSVSAAQKERVAAMAREAAAREEAPVRALEAIATQLAEPREESKVAAEALLSFWNLTLVPEVSMGRKADPVILVAV